MMALGFWDIEGDQGREGRNELDEREKGRYGRSEE
jgi:hypothetical protein